MYTREILEPRTTPVEGGAPLQGTWTRAFDEVNLLDIKKPYKVPMPGWIRDYRIKECDYFIIQDDKFYLAALLCNFKLFRGATVTLYDKERKERLGFRKVIPGGGWKLPRELKNASVVSRSMGFFFRIHSWLDAETLRLDLDVESTRKRPSFTGHARYNLKDGKTVPLVVSLLFSERRNMYAFKVMAPVQGDVIFGGRHISLEPEKTSGIFCDFKGFYPYRMHAAWCAGTGFDQSGRRFGFHIAESQARESYKNNENALWIDGSLTPLPPVKITLPGGVDKEWVIQDMEGMVDLVFTPQEQVRYSTNFIITRTEYDSPIGQFNGAMVNAQGEKIPVKNMWGTCEKVYLRV
jgi:hypothetical protein